MARTPLALAATFVLASQLPVPAQVVVHVPGDYPDPQAAIDAVPPGSTVVIQGGTWGPLLVNKALRIVGEPRPSLEGGYRPPVPGFSSPITLEGPGSGSVELGNLSLGGFIDGVLFSRNAAGISGGGFDELVVVDSSVSSPEWFSLTGLGYGEAGIETDVPFVWIERSSVKGSTSDIDATLGTFAPHGEPGIRSGGTVALWDATVTGGGVGIFGTSIVPCPPSPGGCLSGVGGTGVECLTLYRSGSTIQGGKGATWITQQSQFCCQQASGQPTSVAQEISIVDDVDLLGPPRLGGSITVSWTGPFLGGAVRLFFSLGFRPPRLVDGGFVFLNNEALLLGTFPAPGSRTFAIPLATALLGEPFGFQVQRLVTGQISRPVGGIFLP